MSTTLRSPFVYEPPAHEITAEATAAVTERQLVAVSGNRTPGGNVAVAPAGAGARAFGVAVWTAASGQLVRIARGGVVKVTAGAAAINAGDPIASDTNGHAVTATGTAAVIGLAINGAAAGAVAEVAFYA